MASKRAVPKVNLNIADCITMIMFFVVISSFALLSAKVAKADTGNESIAQLSPTVIGSPSLAINYQITNNRTPTVTGDIDNPDAGIYVIINNQTYRGVNNGDGGWAAGVSEALADGSYDVTIVATSSGGAKIAMTAMDGITIDTVAPKATVSDLTSSDPSPAVSGTVDDDTAMIVVDIDGSLYNAANNEDNTWTLPEGSIQPGLKPGTYKISVSVGDLAGNLNAKSAQATITITEGSPKNPSQPSDNPSLPSGSDSSRNVPVSSIL